MQNRAREAVVASDLSLASEVLNTDKVREGDFPDNLSDADRGSGVPASTDTLYYYVHDNATIPPTFCVTGANGSAFMYVTESTVPQKGTCPAHAYLLNDEGSNEGDPAQTVFVFDTTANGCSGTVQLPVALPTSGGVIDWGDGATENLSSALQAHTYSSPGTYTVTYDGPIDRATYFPSVNTLSARCLIRVNQWSNTISPTRVNFFKAANLTHVAEPPHTVTNMSNMFAEAKAFNQDIGGWDTSNVTDMSAMFVVATSFNQPLDGWDVSNVANLIQMFSGATSFNQPLGSWDTSKVTSMVRMFGDTHSFNQPLSSWDTSNVTNMSGMFRGSSFNYPINDWDTAKVTNMSGMFDSAQTFNQPLNNWNTANVTKMDRMFANSKAFNQPINNWNTAKVSDVTQMFRSALYFNQNISGWNVSTVTSKDSFHANSPLVQSNVPPSLW